MTDYPRIDSLLQRVQRDPASIAFAQLAEEYRRLRRFEEAISICRGGLTHHPLYFSARVTLGRSLMELQRYDEAQREFDLVLEHAPDNLAAIRALAEIHQRRGDFGEESFRPPTDTAGDVTAEAPSLPDGQPASETAALPDATAGDPLEPFAGDAGPVDRDPILAQLEDWLAAIAKDRSA